MSKSIVIPAIAAGVLGVGFLFYLSRPAAFSPSTVQAGGTVFVRGKPKAGVRVTYHPQFNIGSVKFTPNGITNSQGNFTLSSGKPGDGAPAGEYVVTFDFPVLSSGGVENEIDLFEGKYSSATTSQWKVTVSANSQESFQLD
jgi:hypothetical protein